MAEFHGVVQDAQDNDDLILDAKRQEVTGRGDTTTVKRGPLSTVTEMIGPQTVSEFGAQPRFDAERVLAEVPQGRRDQRLVSLSRLRPKLGPTCAEYSCDIGASSSRDL